MPRKRYKKVDHQLKFDVMPVEVEAILTDTAEWTDAEFGFYTRLLLYAWRNKGISPDVNRLINVAGGASGIMDGTTSGSTGGHTTNVPSGTTDEQYAGHYTGTNRVKMWEFIKHKFRKKEVTGGYVLVNQRLEEERERVIALHQQRVDASLKGVEARKRKALEKAGNKQAVNSQPDGTTSGSTAGNTVGNTEGGTKREPITRARPEEITSTLPNKEVGKEIHINNGVTTGTTAGTTVGQYPDVVPAPLVAYLNMTYDDLMTKGSSVTKDVTPEIFEKWKEFTRWIIENPEFHPVFGMAANLFPKDYAIIEKEGFRKDNWRPVLDYIFKNGWVQPTFKLFFKIPDAMKKLKIKPFTPEIPKKNLMMERIMQKQKDQIDEMVKKREITPTFGELAKQSIKPGLTLDEILRSVKKQNQPPIKQKAG